MRAIFGGRKRIGIADEHHFAVVLPVLQHVRSGADGVFAEARKALPVGGNLAQDVLRHQILTKREQREHGARILQVEMYAIRTVGGDVLDVLNAADI